MLAVVSLNGNSKEKTVTYTFFQDFCPGPRTKDLEKFRYFTFHVIIASPHPQYNVVLPNFHTDMQNLHC